MLRTASESLARKSEKKKSDLTWRAPHTPTTASTPLYDLCLNVPDAPLCDRPLVDNSPPAVLDFDARARLAGLIDLVQKGFFKGTENIVFLHTGGSAALFAYVGDLQTA